MHHTTQAAPETAQERHQRHIRQLARMAELAEELAEAAAAHARMAFAQLPPGPEQKGEPPSRLQRGPHPANLFAYLAGVVRHSVRLEARLVAAHAAAKPAQADPRRAKIRRAIRQATAGRPDREIRRQQADQLLEAELALDPDHTTTLPDLLDTICQDVGFELNYAGIESELAARETPQPPAATTPAPDWHAPAATPPRSPWRAHPAWPVSGQPVHLPPPQIHPAIHHAAAAHAGWAARPPPD